MNNGCQPDMVAARELTRRIVAAVNPLRVILFGSVARAQAGPDSDLDLLVVVADGVHRRETARKLYRELYGFGIAKDIVVATESDIREYGAAPGLIYRRALSEGKDLYHAAA